MEVVGSPGGMSALVIRACQYMFSCDCMFNHAAIYFCPVALSFFVLTKFNYRMPYNINGRETFLCLCLFVVIF